MQPLPVGYMPNLPPPCFSLRSRREVNTTDTANSRLAEHWQTDSPSLQYAQRDVHGTERYRDMNPTPSRLYREDMRQAQPYVTPSQNTAERQREADLDSRAAAALDAIQSLGNALASTLNPLTQTQIRAQLATQQELYANYTEQKKQLSTDAMSRNPYFDKYDVQGDTRNIIRELRAVVSEDIVDRGMAESQKLLRRGMENRWVPVNFAESQGLDALTAYELMKPKFNKQDKVYF